MAGEWAKGDDEGVPASFASPLLCRDVHGQRVQEAVASVSGLGVAGTAPTTAPSKARGKAPSKAPIEAPTKAPIKAPIKPHHGCQQGSHHGPHRCWHDQWGQPHGGSSF